MKDEDSLPNLDVNPGKIVKHFNLISFKQINSTSLLVVKHTAAFSDVILGIENSTMNAMGARNGYVVIMTTIMMYRLFTNNFLIYFNFSVEGYELDRPVLYAQIPRMTEYVNLKHPIEFVFKVVCHVVGLDAPACGVTEISDFLDPTSSINVPTLVFGVVAGVGCAYAGYKLSQCYKSCRATKNNITATQSDAPQSLRNETSHQQQQRLLDISDDPTPATPINFDETETEQFLTARNSSIEPTTSSRVYEHQSLSELVVRTPIRVKFARLVRDVKNRV